MFKWLKFFMSSKLPIRGNWRGPGGKCLASVQRRAEKCQKKIRQKMARRTSVSQNMAAVQSGPSEKKQKFTKSDS